MRIDLLDMGDEAFGDAVVVQRGGLAVLVDSGHPRGHARRGATASIPEQLAVALGRPAPFRFDLLIVTHCHGDHFGCLPALVENGTVVADRALVADEDLGFPVSEGTSRTAIAAVNAKAAQAIEQVVAGLREDPREFASDADLRAFLVEAVGLEPRYRAMLDSLERRGTRVIRFRGVDDPEGGVELATLKAELSSLGLEVLGPTQEQMLLCTDAIATFAGRARRALTKSANREGAAVDAPTLLRLVSANAGRHLGTGAVGPLPLDDRARLSAALDNQSIVIKLGVGPDTALLTGDMRFAATGLETVERHVKHLLRRAAKAGPYAFVKVPHHGSRDGFDARVATALGAFKALGITTGRGASGYPHDDVVALLAAMPDEVELVRTDKDGHVSLTLKEGAVVVERVREFLDDDCAHPGATMKAATPALVVRQPPQPVAADLPRLADASDATAFVEVVTRIPHVKTRVTVTVTVEPDPTPAKPRPPQHDGPAEADTAPRDTMGALAAGRALPPLLFVTALERLARNVGGTEAADAVGIIKGAGQGLLDLSGPGETFKKVREALQSFDVEGVVILGGYDVVPSVTYDVLPRELRAELGAEVVRDPDEFVVWSDQRYGDLTGDALGDLPVSRVPDGRSPELLRAALCGCSSNPGAQRFGIRNVARPFAQRVFDNLPGDQVILVSEPTRAKAVDAASVDASAIYIMLHGSHRDTGLFWGETGQGEFLPAMSVGTIPDPCGGVVLSGCCFGALTVATPASHVDPAEALRPWVPEQSLALSFLRRGARAFVGCTGAHYSPINEDPAAELDYFGGPLHRAFWERVLVKGEGPAKALFGAKMDYIRDMPHGRTSAEGRAIEYKTLRQFTCLGLGW